MLVKQLLAFRTKITTATDETLDSWREKDHDDMVLAVAIAAWLGERSGSGPNEIYMAPSTRGSNAGRRGLFGVGRL